MKVIDRNRLDQQTCFDGVKNGSKDNERVRSFDANGFSSLGGAAKSLGTGHGLDEKGDYQSCETQSERQAKIRTEKVR